MQLAQLDENMADNIHNNKEDNKARKLENTHIEQLAAIEPPQ